MAGGKGPREFLNVEIAAEAKAAIDRFSEDQRVSMRIVIEAFGLQLADGTLAGTASLAARAAEIYRTEKAARRRQRTDPST